MALQLGTKASTGLVIRLLVERTDNGRLWTYIASQQNYWFVGRFIIFCPFSVFIFQAGAPRKYNRYWLSRLKQSTLYKCSKHATITFEVGLVLCDLLAITYLKVFYFTANNSHCRSTIYDAGPTFKQHWLSASCLLGTTLPHSIRCFKISDTVFYITKPIYCVLILCLRYGVSYYTAEELTMKILFVGITSRGIDMEVR